MSTSIAPLASSFDAWLYDGQSPLRQPSRLTLTPDGVQLDPPAAFWPYSGLHIACDGSFDEPVRLEHSAAPGETLCIDHPDFFHSLLQHALTLRSHRVAYQLSSWPAVLAACLAIAAVVTFIYTTGVRFAAETAARFAPRAVEERLGQATVNILVPQAARTRPLPHDHPLSLIAARLTAAAGPAYTYSVTYSRSSTVNAFAAPGGRIVVYQGLLDHCETPEEYAAVFAHEIQHVLHRHSIRAMARQLSGQSALTLLAGASGTPAALDAASTLTALHYSREAETEADLDGIDLLIKAGINPAGMASFFRRLHSNPLAGDAPIQYLSTHPDLLDRAALIDATLKQRPARAFTPIPAAAGWNHLP